MTALLLALSWRSFGILKTAFGNDKNKLCEISRRSSCVRLANSSGNLLIWLLEIFKSVEWKWKINSRDEWRIKKLDIYVAWESEEAKLVDLRHSEFYHAYLWWDWIWWRIWAESSWWHSSWDRRFSVQCCAWGDKRHLELVLVGNRRDLDHRQRQQR